MLGEYELPERPYVNLVGRDEEYRTIISWLSRSRFFIFAIGGMGGIGKTALALESCYYFQKEYGHLPEEERFDYIIWTSAKFIDMTPFGRVRIPTHQRILRAIMARMAEVLRIPEALTADEDREKELIFDALSRSRVLLVIDSFEQLEDPKKPVVDFLQELPSPTKVLVTSRPQETVEGAKHLFLSGLKEPEGLGLVEQLCMAFGEKVKLNEGQQKEVYEISGGIPLAIVWGLRRILTEYEPYSAVINKLKRGYQDLSDYCVSDSFQAIKGRKAEEIAFALLPLSSPISRQVIGEIVELSREVKIRDDELNLLLLLQLVMRNRDDKFQITPFAQTYLINTIPQNKLAEIQEKWAHYYYNFIESLLGKHGRVDAYTRRLNELGPELDNIIGILEAIVRVNSNLYCDLLEILRYLLYLSGNWVSRDKFMADGVKAANENNDPCREILFASDLGWVATYRRKFDLALRFFDAAKPALELCPEAYYRAKYYLDLARLHDIISESGTLDQTEAETLYLKALEEAEKVTTVPGICSTCLYYLGLLYYKVGNTGEAQKQFEKGLSIAESVNATREIGRHQSMLALILADNKQFEEARQIFEQIIVNAENFDDHVRVADYKFSFAKVEYQAGNRQKATALLNEAERKYSEVGRRQDAEAVIQFGRELGLTL